LAAIFGRHPVLEALRAGRSIDRLYLAEGAKATGIVDEILRLAQASGVTVTWIDRRALDRLAEGANHQGVLAEAQEFTYATLDDVVQSAARGTAFPLLVALDALEDPQNFGTLLRSADAVGADGILIPLHRAVGVTPAVEKSSAGAVAHLPIARVTNLSRALVTLKESGYWIVGLDHTGPELYDRFPVDSPLVLVVGAEGKGLGRLVRESCDLLVRLPMRGHVESLNAAVAGSIVLYDILRRRSVSDERPAPEDPSSAQARRTR